jgi:predicted nuclease with RNAse H fold
MQIHARLSGTHSVLIALDAPLGWPAALSEQLPEHIAGKAFSKGSDSLFRRRTDQVVREKLGKAPLEVAANFLARTAVVALRMLEDLSQLSNAGIALAWRPWKHEGIGAIEVYPAGTLRAYQKLGLVSAGGATIQNKRSLLRKLQGLGKLRFQRGAAKAIANEHALDSILCCVAAVDFQQGLAMRPNAGERALATKEGWIWVRDPGL